MPTIRTCLPALIVTLVMASASHLALAQDADAERSFTWSGAPVAARVDAPPPKPQSHPSVRSPEPAPSGRLRVRETAGADVEVFIDDARVGPAPWEGNLPAGYHVVALKGRGLASALQSIRVSPNGESELAVEAARLDGTLEVAVFPRTAAIAINGRRVGFGSFRSTVPAGYYEIEVQAPGMGHATTGVSMGAGQNVSKELVLIDRGPSESDKDADSSKAYRGFVAQVGLMGAKANQATQSDADPAGNIGFANVPDLAAGGYLRLGSAFGPISIEVTGAALADYRGENAAPGNLCAQAPVPGCEEQSGTWMSYGLAAFGGLGGHLSTTTQGIRLTAGASAGIAHRALRVTDQVSGNQVAAETYNAPGLLLDAGLLLGSTPGAKLFLGAVAWMDFPASDVSLEVPADPASGQSARSYVLASGRQFYVGPSIGLQLGH